jgi:restriction endonuclease S subunit
VKNTSICLPPIDEQRRIAAYLNKVSANIDKIKLIKFGNSKLSLSDDMKDNQLQHLVSYRDSLIHECVTGKRQITDIAIEKEIKRALA